MQVLSFHFFPHFYFVKLFPCTLVKLNVGGHNNEMIHKITHSAALDYQPLQKSNILLVICYIRLQKTSKAIA